MLVTSTNAGLRMLRMFRCDSTDILDGAGKCIFLFRALRFMQAVTYTLLDESDTCIEAPYLPPQDKTFSIVTVRMTVDIIVVVCALHFLPFRRVHIIGIFIVEALYQSLRFQSCKYRLDLPGKFDLFCWTINNTIIGAYLFNMVFPALTLERSINATQQNVNRLRDAAAEKTRLINTLCADLKVPVQQTSTLLALLSPYAAQGLAPDLFAELVEKDRFDRALSEHLNKSSSAISTVVDRILFLMRIREGRFVFACEEEVALSDAVALTAKDLLTCYDLGHAGSERDGLDGLFARVFSVDLSFPCSGASVSETDVVVKSSKSCLSVLLFYSISMVLLHATFWSTIENKVVSFAFSKKSVTDEPIHFSAMLAAAMQFLRIHVDVRIYGLDELLLAKRDVYGNKSSDIKHYVVCRVNFDDINAHYRERTENQDVPRVQSFGRANKEYADDYMYHYQSCMMLCQEVCKCSGGEFAVLPDGMIEFSLPCVFQFSHTIPCNRVSQQRQDSGQADATIRSDEPLPPSQRTTTISSEALPSLCIYSPSPSILLLITESLKNAVTTSQTDSDKRRSRDRSGVADSNSFSPSPSGSRPSTEGMIAVRKTFPIPIFSELNMADMHVRSVVIVSSIEDCRKLRHRGYRKKVVLMSERLAYYGQLEGEYDYAVSLPLSSALELQLLVQWINSNKRNDGVGRKSDKRLADDWQTPVYRKFDWSRQTLGFLAIFGSFSVPVINSRHMLNYMRWRMAYYGRKLQLEYQGDNRQSFNTILESRYGLVSGKVIVSFIMAAPSVAKVLSEMILWPYGFLIGVFMVLMSFAIIFTYISVIVNQAVARFIFVVQFIIFVSTNVVIIFTERLRRKEYLELREVIMSRDFVERCVNACWRDTRHPLTSITVLQSKLYDRIRTRCLRR
eukprot:gene31812-38462_t